MSLLPASDISFILLVDVLKDNSGAKGTFGLITHCYLVNRYLRFFFMIAECK